MSLCFHSRFARCAKGSNELPFRRKSEEERGGRWDDGPSPQPPWPNDTEERQGEGTITHTTSTTERIVLEVI